MLGDQKVAEVDLATSFNAGDNFRVLASLSKESLTDLGRSTSVPTTGAVSGFDGVATPQLSIWRHVHVEKDRMAQITPNNFDGKITKVIQGPSQQGDYWKTIVETNYNSLTANMPNGGNFYDQNGRRWIIGGIDPPIPGSPGSRLTLFSESPPPPGGFGNLTGSATIYVGDWQKGNIRNVTWAQVPPPGQSYAIMLDTPIATANEYEGGRMVWGSESYPIAGNTSGQAGGDTIFLDHTAGEPDYAMPPGVPGTGGPPTFVEIYQDDFKGGGNGPAVLRVNVNDDSNLYDMMQTSTVLNDNKFAAAYIEPEYDDLTLFDSPDVPPTPHVIGAFGVRGLCAPFQAEDQFEAPMYWGVYVGTASEADHQFSGDPSSTPRLMGGTVDDQKSLIFLETIRDNGQEVDFTATQNRGAVTVHEVGHQFGLAFNEPSAHRASPPNIMSGGGVEVHAWEYVFYAIDVAHMRDMVQGPGHG